MAIVVIASVSGNVGKSTIAKHCVGAHAPTEAHIISVETINDGVDAEAQFKGSDVMDILNEAMVDGSGRSVVIDVGSSNIEAFVMGLKRFGSGINDEFALWVVPFVAAQKVERDTATTVKVLRDMGVKKSQIVLVGNRVSADTAEACEGIAKKIHGEYGVGVVAGIAENDVFAMDLGGRTLRQVAADATNYRNEIQAATDASTKRQLVLAHLLGMLAKKADGDLAATAKEIWGRVK